MIALYNMQAAGTLGRITHQIAAAPKMPLGLRLLTDGTVAPHAMVKALSGPGRLTDELLGRGLVDPAVLYRALARHYGIGLADFAAVPPDVRLVDRLGPLECLRHGLLPWHNAGGVTVIATTEPQEFAAHQASLTDLFGPVVPALTSRTALETALLALRGPLLARASETTVIHAESCRFWTPRTSASLALGCVALAGVLALRPTVGLGALLALTLLMTAPLRSSPACPPCRLSWPSTARLTSPHA